MNGLRTLSIRVAPLPGESLDSWLEALARRCWMPLPALIAALGLPTRAGTHRLVTSLAEQDLRRLEVRLALPAGRLDEAVVPGDLFGRRSPQCRFCPQCLAETQGRWKLRWWLPWTFACTRHQALLHVLCPGCGTAPRQTVPGPVHQHRPSQCFHKPVPKKNDICGTDMSAVAPLSLSPQHPLTDVQQQLDVLDLYGHDAAERIFPAADRLLTQLENKLSTGHSAAMDTVSHQARELIFEQTTEHASLFGSWRARERARTVITPEFLNREYDASNRSLLQISKELGLPYAIVIERYKELGRSLKIGCRPRSLDDHWLREQYLVGLRSIKAIGSDIGTSEGPVKRRLIELGVTLRPTGAHSRREVLARLDESVPRDIRASVEGTFHGWLRLRRFQIHMAFPSLQATAAYLKITPSSLARQIKQLETAIGAQLFTRAAPPVPHQATDAGALLLRHLDEEHAQELMRHALGPDITPLPTKDVLANAVLTFGGSKAPLSRLPPDTALPEHLNVPAPLLPLLRHLFYDTGSETYAGEIHAATGIESSTIYVQLRRLKAAGWLRSQRELPSNRMRRAGNTRVYYSLTPAARLVPLQEFLDAEQSEEMDSPTEMGG
ncbi:hypothetical protein CG740_33200 [Streptomyces sp. CB01201]|uniref:TniQ family protein n=1 Tax=Streptomyces sp. CB01201 TaxID=2020324 RepID=UPI000C27A16F|nr:TniQ family protein [Streptomyces sp. CB01201]PJM98940.1 hypothetical protein CG740_33200 [Streptomyces sp. CB01201]